MPCTGGSAEPPKGIEVGIAGNGACDTWFGVFEILLTLDWALYHNQILIVGVKK